jgi:hypothetical protein
MQLGERVAKFAGGRAVGVIVLLTWGAVALQAVQSVQELGIPVRVMAGIAGMMLTVYVWGIGRRLEFQEQRLLAASEASNPGPAAQSAPQTLESDPVKKAEQTMAALREQAQAVKLLLDRYPPGAGFEDPRAEAWGRSYEDVIRSAKKLATTLDQQARIRFENPTKLPRETVGAGRGLAEYHERAARIEAGLLETIGYLHGEIDAIVARRRSKG